MTTCRYVSVLLFLCVCALFNACAGGGSAGTGSGGVERTFQGKVQSLGAPVQGARISLLETDASAITGEDGSFSLRGVLDSAVATLELVAVRGQAEQIVEVPLEDQNATVIAVDISLDAQKLVQSVSRFYMWARVVGPCARFFSNEAVIKQIRRTPDELPCTMRFFVNGGTTRLEQIPGAIQVRSCDSRQWRTLNRGATGVGEKAGVGEIDFTFIDNQRNCQYRMVAPFELPPLPELSVLLQTFTILREQGELRGGAAEP